VFALSVAPADSTAIVALRESGMAVSFVAENQPFVQVRCADPGDCMNARQVAALTEVADQVIWLDLARSTVGDAQLEVLARFQHLTRLHLENTGVTDDGLEHIRNLPFLEYVNLYGTQISDAGLSVLDTLPALQRLYLWQSDVTREGADAFKSRRPDVVVNVGAATEE
jgi:hypothetical protein